MMARDDLVLFFLLGHPIQFSFDLHDSEIITIMNGIIVEPRQQFSKFLIQGALLAELLGSEEHAARPTPGHDLAPVSCDAGQHLKRAAGLPSFNMPEYAPGYSHVFCDSKRKPGRAGDFSPACLPVVFF
jgi:hypothetical protein